jgi:hypothetical protein
VVDFGNLGSDLILALSAVLNLLVLAYRWPRLPSVRGFFDRLQQRLTGRPDWSWVRLWHVMVPLLVVSAVNLAWQISTVHCADDSLAIFASGRAVLTGHDPFQVTYCSGSSIDYIPYGLSQVALDGLAALSGTFAGVWVVWELVALLVVPLVWVVAGDDRRYVAVLAATSVLYLPNIATNIGVDNAIVPVAVLLMLYALASRGGRGFWFQGLAAFLSTARFPALFPLLGASASLGRHRWKSLVLVAGVFAGSVLLSYALWGWGAIGVVYLDQFSRLSGGTLNLFAVLLQQGWFLPSLVSAAIQGGLLLLLVLFVHARGYSPRAASVLPLLGVMSLSQYLNFHFVVWIVPAVLLGASVNRWLFIYGVTAALDESVAEWYLGRGLGIWWPYELLGVVLSVLLVYLLILIVRSEEVRLRTARRAAKGPSEAGEEVARRGQS